MSVSKIIIHGLDKCLCSDYLSSDTVLCTGNTSEQNSGLHGSYILMMRRETIDNIIE